MSAHGISKIIQRLGGTAEESLITKSLHYLERSQRNHPKAQTGYQSKETEARILEEFIESEKIWYNFHEFSLYLDEGAEQRVFMDENRGKVIKMNDAIFYVNWSQYFESILIHNLLFPTTKYTLCGFLKLNSVLYSIIDQDYIKSTQNTSILDIQKIMIQNGFTIKKRNDYVHHEYGLIIEDLHEENVLTKDGVLFFIDTVIYLKD